MTLEPSAGEGMPVQEASGETAICVVVLDRFSYTKQR